MSARPLSECPECGENALQKLIGAGAAAIVRDTTTPCHADKYTAYEKRLQNMKKLGTDSKTPPWRGDGEPVNKAILADPEKYIQTGEV
jgi:hypothetical protein